MSLTKVGQYFNRFYSTANSVALMGSATGVMICAPLSQFLILEYGWQGALLIFGGVCANIVVCGAVITEPCCRQIPEEADRRDLYVQEKERKKSDRNFNPKTELIEKKNPKDKHDKYGFFLFRASKYLTLLAATFAAFFVWSGWVIYVVPHAEHKGLITYSATSLATAGGLGNVLGKLTVPTLMDRKVISPITVIYLGLSMSGVSLVLDLIFTDVYTLVILSAFFGFGFGVSSLALFVEVKDVAGPLNLPKALPWLTLASGFGRMLAGFLTGKYYNVFILFSWIHLSTLLQRPKNYVKISDPACMVLHPTWVIKQGNYHVIVVTKCSGVQHPMISMLFIPLRISAYHLS